jgi:indolepyruvate ferredoxin oxidoreductase beta subunit
VIAMKKDIVLAGVGGQGVLSVAAVIAEAARREGLHVKQGEVHGMAQRGGSVYALLRLADHPIHSDLVARGTADLLVGLEPVECLRYVEYLAPGGTVVTGIDPVRNVPDYPDRERVLGMLHRLPRVVVVEASAHARAAGSPQTAGTVITGAASHFLPLRPAVIEACLVDAFARKGERVVEANLLAFRAGREAVPCPAA